jgi:hypothetical protein
MRCAAVQCDAAAAGDRAACGDATDAAVDATHKASVRHVVTRCATLSPPRRRATRSGRVSASGAWQSANAVAKVATVAVLTRHHSTHTTARHRNRTVKRSIFARYWSEKCNSLRGRVELKPPRAGGNSDEWIRFRTRFADAAVRDSHTAKRQCFAAVV